MKQNIKREMQASMDALRFSREEKNAMVYRLTMQSQDKKVQKKTGSKKLMLIALAAVMLMATLTGAAMMILALQEQVQDNTARHVRTSLAILLVMT